MLECGANIRNDNAMSNDAFTLASAFGRRENIQRRLERVKDYDLERQNGVVGAHSASGCCEYGYRRTEGNENTTLCESGAHVDALTHAGFSVLMAACANEDSDPMDVKEILSRIDSKWNATDVILINIVRRGGAKLASSLII